MTLPSFSAHDDPGPDFAALLRRVAPALAGAGVASDTSSSLGAHETVEPSLLRSVPHGTTCVSVRHADGVVLAGDRRATSGHFISNHAIEKVYPADRHSGIAIAGAAGPSVEMVRLFQLQLEHYEKVEGVPISLEGKANQLSQMIRGNLGAAMQGLAVVPIFAGFDVSAARGRIFEYDITGGRYEERDYATTGSGSMHASTALKLGFRKTLTESAAIDLTLEALLVASEADSATGGPDPYRELFPVVAVIDVDGYRRVERAELRRRSDRLLRRHRNRRAKR